MTAIIRTLVALAGLALASSCQPPRPPAAEAPPAAADRYPAQVLSAFFGLDHALPRESMRIWRQAPGQDGMPVVFSHEIDPATLDPACFQITTRDGQVYAPAFATFQPADEAFELRTVLLIGDYGSAQNPPERLTIAGDLRTRSGQRLQGATVAVTPLAAGPFLAYAEWFGFDHQYPYRAAGPGCDCPPAGTGVVVRTVWAGGVRAPDGQELGAPALARFTVRLQVGADTLAVHPYHLADLGDNDNNVDLCLRETGIPLTVEVAPHTAIDPRGDHNPATRIAIRSRW